VALSSL
jgi:hypothetical protein